MESYGFKIPEEWKEEQASIKEKIDLSPIDISQIRYIAGIDVSYNKTGYGFVSIVITEKNECVEKISYIEKVDIPYIPGYLTFRELPLVLKALEKISIQPDIFMFDGNGMLHPRKAGLATHASVYLKKPCIGVAKDPFIFEGVPNSKYKQPGNEFGAYTYICNDSNEVLGITLRTVSNTRPVYVSVGNYMSLENARDIVLQCIRTDKSHIPYPTWLADQESKKMRRMDENVR